MSKATKTAKTRTLQPREAGYMLRSWACNHHPTYSEIEAYIPITGQHEIIADIHDAQGIDAEVVAGLITRAVNSFERNQDMINQMAFALELCLQCADCLSWEAEHEAQVLVRRAQEGQGRDGG